ncbi:hypothetical protein NDU88_005000 [Pleurodeles waltl]|uniref:Uncharacterized protein n=1 Tax=Pleurodeles waltl TaxID=8319 RepID=A0AAV7TA07_PLEWA|nr:hypothetical protein NDU88_005000 [Pleurodeles waltl]
MDGAARAAYSHVRVPGTESVLSAEYVAPRRSSAPGPKTRGWARFLVQTGGCHLRTVVMEDAVPGAAHSPRDRVHHYKRFIKAGPRSSPQALKDRSNEGHGPWVRELPLGPRPLLQKFC